MVSFSVSVISGSILALGKKPRGNSVSGRALTKADVLESHGCRAQGEVPDPRSRVDEVPAHQLEVFQVRPQRDLLPYLPVFCFPRRESVSHRT